MSYRDDRDAWRDKAEQLERELEQARRQLQQRAEGGAQRGEASRPLSSETPSRTTTWPVITLLALPAIVAVAVITLTGGELAPVAPIVVLFLFLASLLFVMSRFVEVVPPNRAIVLSGRRNRQPDGRVAGFRIVRGGRAFRIPLLEGVHGLDLGLHRIAVRVRGLYARGGHKLDVELAAWVGLADASPGIDAAAERFLDMPRERIAEVARDTLEGALREVVAGLTPEQLIEDRLAFRHRLLDALDEDMRKLGLALESVFILSVGDEAGYIAQLGRERIARVLRDAEIRKSERKS